MANERSEDDWREVIRRGETVHLDFKGPMAFSGDACPRLTKDIVAMANVRDGGTILIGVAEDANKSTSIVGLTPEQLATFDPTRITDYVNRFFEPPVSLTIERPVIDGHPLVAIRVQEFDASPIVCSANGPLADPQNNRSRCAFYAGSIIVRAVGAKSEPIHTAEDMHALIRLAVTKTSDRLLTDIRRILDGSTLGPEASTAPFGDELAVWTETLAERTKVWATMLPGYGCLTLVALPDLVVKELDPESMRKIVQASHVEGAGLTLPNAYPDHVTKIQNRRGMLQGTLDLNHYQELWQLHESGAFMDASVLHYRESDGKAVLPFEAIIWQVALGVQFMQRLYGELGATRVQYEFKLEGVAGQRLGSIDPHRLFFNGDYTTVDTMVSSNGERSVLELRSGWRSIVFEVVRDLFMMFNFTISAAAVEQRLNSL